MNPLVKTRALSTDNKYIFYLEEQAQQIANLTIQNQDLRTQLQALTTQLDTMQNILQQLTLNNNTTRNSNNRNGSNRNNNNRTNNNRNGNNRRSPNRPIAYCWTHGGIYSGNHNSQTCWRPAQNHVREATLENRIGGSEANL